MKDLSDRPLRHLFVVVAAKLVVLFVLWWKFVRPLTVAVDAERTTKNLEPTFISLFFFSWDRLSKAQHLLATLLIAVGTNLSALWILIANARMHNPVSAELNSVFSFIAGHMGAAKSQFYCFVDIPTGVYSAFDRLRSN